MRAFVISVVLVLSIINANSNDFRYLRTQEGLNDGKINTIAQDSTGNIWIGTYSGLTKYDGVILKEFRPQLKDPYSLPTKKVQRLFIDSYDHLWISSTRELCIYDKIKERFYTINFKRDNSNPIDIISLSEYKGNLFVHTTEGFYLLPLKQNYKENIIANKIEFSEPNNSNGKFIYSKSIDDNLYVIKEGTFNKSEIYKVEYLIEGDKTAFNLKFITELNSYVNDVEYVSGQSTLYFATSNGLLSYLLVTGNFASKIYFEGRNIQQVEYTANNELYCSAPGPILMYLDLHTGLTGQYTVEPFVEGSLLNNEILTLFEDFSGNLWIGHQGQGISILNLYPKKFVTFSRDPINRNSLSSNVITCFSETDESYFIGGRNNGLNIISKKDLSAEIPKFKQVNIPDDNTSPGYGIWNIAKQSESRYWLATEKGLFIMSKSGDGDSWDISAFKGSPKIDELVWNLLIDANGNIWCGTFNGGLLLIPNPERNTQNRYYRYKNIHNDSTSISDNYVKELMIDSRNRFWVGTLNGLNCLTVDYRELDLSGQNKPQLKFNRYYAEVKDGQGLNNNEINGLKENIDGTIWISTNGGGINIFNPATNQFKYITTADGLPSDDVYSMVPDEFGNMWISTLRGLVSYNQLQEDPVISVYDKYDGIQGEVFMVGASYKSNDGIVFFGGNNGFTCFNPTDIKPNKVKAKIAFSDLYFQNRRIEAGDTISDNGFILNSSINFTNKITLPFEKSYFRIKVSTLHFQAPLKNKFKYKLEGYMNRWSTKNSSDDIAFANLPFGEYILKVRGISSDFVESEDEKILTIIVQPPWYKRWYAIMIFILLILSVIIGFLYILINRQKLIYQRQLNELTISNNESKMMFLTNIAHEIRTPLSLIIAPIEDMLQNFSAKEGRWNENLQLIHRNSTYLLKLTNQIIDFRKLNAGKAKLKLEKTDIVRVIKDVVLNFRGFESKKKIKLYLNTPLEKVHVLIDVQKIEEVLYNLLSNAFKNTSENKSITVSMSFIENDGPANTKMLRISVFNEGKEISEEDKSRIFERFYKINENNEGAGIGLSFARSLIELHNGTLNAESVNGKGVLFNIDLPADVIELSFSKTEDLSFEQQLIQLPVTKNGHAVEELVPDNDTKVLIIEDNAELRDFLNNVLSRSYHSIVASDGKEGWEIIKKEMPALIISDVIMPNMNGYELCDIIKETKETCHIPIILLTAKNTEENQIEGYKHGADAFITKPFDINVLISQVRRLIKNRELIRQKYLTKNFMVEIKSSTPKDVEFVQTVRRLLEENITDPDFNVSKISEHLNISTTQLYRRIKQLTGHSPVEFIRVIKLQKAYGLLTENDKTVKEVSYLIGFNSLSYFIKCFKEQFGVTPANFRDKGVLTE